MAGGAGKRMTGFMIGFWFAAASAKTMMTIPLTFSIANELAFGFTAYTLLKLFRGRFRKVNWFVYVLTASFIARFVYLAG